MLLTADEFAEQLNDRLRMLFRSALAYDQGDYAEATRLAGSIARISYPCPPASASNRTLWSTLRLMEQ
jgi:hypothetical protein